MTIFNGLFKQSWVRSKSNDNFHGVCVGGGGGGGKRCFEILYNLKGKS